MNSAKLLNLATTSGLGITSRKFIKKKLASAVPKECFGVFVSVHRSKSHTKGTNDVHGCIGFFDNDYKPTDGEIIIEKMTNVAYSATFEDSRKDNFDKPIYLDPLAKFEVIFMLTPLMDIDIETGKINGTNEVFDNNKYGIIVGGESRATYLPHVFEDITWIDIRNSLITKGSGLQEETIQNMPLEELKSRFKFFCYNAKIYSKTIFNALDGAYLQFLNKKIVSFMNKNYTKFVPYSVTKSSIVEEDKTSIVRNAATLLELYDFKNDLSEDVVTLIKRDLNFYKYLALLKINKKSSEMSEINLNKLNMEKIEIDEQSIRQALGFLLIALDKFKLLSSNEKQIFTTYLFEHLNDLEPKFELGEVLIGLVDISKGIIDKRIIDKQKEMFLACKQLKPTLDNCFEFNWHSKFLLSLYNANKRNPPKLVKEHAKNLFSKMKQIIIKLNETTNTNYVAVCLEGLASLIKVLNVTLTAPLKAKLLKLIYLLETKRDKDGLIKFLDNSKRIDITGHVICGYKVLKDIMRQSKKSKKKNTTSSLYRKSLKKVTIN